MNRKKRRRTFCGDCCKLSWNWMMNRSDDELKADLFGKHHGKRDHSWPFMTMGDFSPDFPPIELWWALNMIKFGVSKWRRLSAEYRRRCKPSQVSAFSLYVHSGSSPGAKIWSVWVSGGWCFRFLQWAMASRILPLPVTLYDGGLMRTCQSTSDQMSITYTHTHCRTRCMSSWLLPWKCDVAWRRHHVWLLHHFDSTNPWSMTGKLDLHMCHPCAFGFEFSQCFFMIFTSHRYAPCIVTRMFGPRNMSRSWNRNQCQARTALQWGSYCWHNTRNHNTSPEQSRNGHDPSWLQHIATYCNVQTWLLNVFWYLLIPVLFFFPFYK